MHHVPGGTRHPLQGHQPGLDGVRGLAILLVMAIHFVGDSRAETLAQRLVVKAAGFGLLGVDLFFVLSGFLITGLLLDSRGKQHYFRDFYARRTLRIFPLYYLVLAIVFVLLPALGLTTPLLEQARQHEIWLWTYTTNFFIAEQSSWSALNYVSHFWSLAIEEHFYLVWPLVVYGLRRETLERVALAVIAGGLVLRIALAWSGVSELSISVLTPCRIDTLCLGGLLAAVARRDGGFERLVRGAGRATVLLGLSIVLVSAWCSLTGYGLPLLHQVRVTLYALFFGALILLSVHPDRPAITRVLRGAALRFFGKYSYGLYVYHGLLTWFFIEFEVERWLDARLHDHALAMTVKALLGVAISLAIAVASYELVEKRFLALKRLFEAPPSPAPLARGEPAP